MEYRTEKDSMGEISVANENLWGAQTQRSLENFRIGVEKMPPEIIDAIAHIKYAAAETNASLGVLSKEKARCISGVCEDIVAGKYENQFPLSVWQTGSGTQTNMNLNEVIAHEASRILGERVHPNDDVNRSQSSNDVFPSAIHIAALTAAGNRLIPALKGLEDELCKLAGRNENTLKTARTHLQDAVPMTFAQEAGAWAALVRSARVRIGETGKELLQLPLGATAVGTGLNAPKGFGEGCVKILSQRLDMPFVKAENNFAALSSKSAAAGFHGALRAAACDLMKIANDVRWLASGPRCGLGEITLPSNEPGSSIMPAKVNPTQCEALSMVCVEVMGADTAVGFAASQGNFQLNVYMPLIAYNIIRSVNLLADAVSSFSRHCIAGITVNTEVMRKNAENSLMLATALAPYIGYDAAAKTARHAYERGISLKLSAVELGLMSAEEYDRAVDIEKMV